MFIEITQPYNYYCTVTYVEHVSVSAKKLV